LGQGDCSPQEANWLSQEGMGFRAEVHRTYVSQLERGLKSPTLSMLLKLSRALKASASIFLSGLFADASWDSLGWVGVSRSMED
jgi:transcriptional regulator with XRE-family HTH domain